MKPSARLTKLHKRSTKKERKMQTKRDAYLEIKEEFQQAGSRTSKLTHGRLKREQLKLK